MKIDKNLIILFFGIVTLLSCFAILQTNAYNDDKGVLKWNPYWFSNNNRFALPASNYHYGGGGAGGMMSRGGGGGGFGGLPKRFGERSSLFGSHQIYKWSPVYFSDGGLFGRSGNYGTKNLNVISNDGFDSSDRKK